jgi:Ribbon-helix-helix protein, copG family
MVADAEMARKGPRPKFTAEMRVNVTPETKAVLEEIADRHGVTLAQVIRNALRYYLDEPVLEPENK